MVRNVSLACDFDGQEMDVRLNKGKWLHEGKLYSKTISDSRPCTTCRRRIDHFDKYNYSNISCCNHALMGRLIFRNPRVPNMRGLLRVGKLRPVAKVHGRGPGKSDGGHRRGRLLRRDRKQRNTVVFAEFWSQPGRLID